MGAHSVATPRNIRQRVGVQTTNLGVGSSNLSGRATLIIGLVGRREWRWFIGRLTYQLRRPLPDVAGDAFGDYDRGMADTTHPPEPRRRIAAFVDGFSIEASPREVFDLARIGDHLPPGTRVYLPAIRRADFADVVLAAARLRRHAMEPVPHFAARGVEDARMLDERLRRLRGEAGVREVLVISGDHARPAGPYDSAMALLATGLLEAHSIERIGVGGHPEGNPNIDDTALAAAIEQKNRYARDSGTALYILTQFCFEAGPIIAWERAIRAAGNSLPVHVGIAGLARLGTLIRYARACGVGPSIRMLARRGRDVTKLATISPPDQLIAALAAHADVEPHCLFRQAHFFPLGALARTAAWLKEQR